MKSVRSIEVSKAGLHSNRVKSTVKPADSGKIVQPKLTVGQSNDKYEQEADRIANQVMRMPERSTLQRKCTACEEEENEKVHRMPLVPSITPLIQKQSNQEEKEVDTSLENRLQQGKNEGDPLSGDTRHFMESRFATDFSSVRMHTGDDAVQMNHELGAQAFTYGNHIYFNSGKYNPGSMQGKHLLAHELTHTLQQTSMINKLSAKQCSKNCTKEDGTRKSDNKFKLTIYVDKEGPFLLIPITGNVGHAWVELEDNTGKFWTFGFWPQTGYDPNAKTSDVEGCIHHPDRAHKSTSSQTFELTQSQFDAAKKVAVDTCTSAPKYNLFGLQCTTFAKKVMEAANLAPSGGFGLIWDTPKVLDAWMRKNELLLNAALPYNISGGKLNKGKPEFSLEFNQQLLSLLGSKARLYWTLKGKLDEKLNTYSTGVGLEIDSQKIWLPAIYFTGEAGKSDGIPSFNYKAGMGYRLDQFGSIRIEYNEIRDMSGSTPDLKRVLIYMSGRLY